MVMMLTAVMIVYRQWQDFVELVPLARLHFFDLQMDNSHRLSIYELHLLSIRR
jgi:hypothetical protein